MKGRQRSLNLSVPVNNLEVEASYIRGLKVIWHDFFQTQVLSPSDYKLITDYDNGDDSVKAWMRQSFKYKITNAFLCLMTKLKKEGPIRSILVMIDDMLQEDCKLSDVFREKPFRQANPECRQFIALLSSEDQFIANMSAKIISKIATQGTVPLEESDLGLYFNWIRMQLRMPKNMYIQNIAACLQRMVRIHRYQRFFIISKNLHYILKALQWLNHTQMVYQLLYCLWRITFNPFNVEKVPKEEIISVLAPLMLDSQNKVVRMILGTFRNLIECSLPKTKMNYCAQMIQHNVLKYTSILQKKEFHDDDVTDDIKFLNDKLQEAVDEISSFKAYSTEVRSKRLEWSPVHKSAQFWRENATRLSENSHELLLVLLGLLQTSRDPLVLRVAVFDIGQYVSYYSPGKRFVEAFGGKDSIMRLLSHAHPLVQTEALLTLQKIMIRNCDILGSEK